MKIRTKLLVGFMLVVVFLVISSAIAYIGLTRMATAIGALNTAIESVNQEATAAMKALEFLQPVLEESGTSSKGRFVIGTVQGDIHNIGKDIVIMILKGSGWEVTDLGVDVSPEDFCSAVAEGDFHILGLSSLLTMTMPSTVKTIEALEAAGLRSKVKIMVGGAPTTRQWADSIGADGWADDAPSAVEVATTLIA